MVAELHGDDGFETLRLSRESLDEVLGFLAERPLINVYLRARLVEETVASLAQTIVVRKQGRLVLVAAVTSNVVLGTGTNVDHDDVERSVDEVARWILRDSALVRAIICEAALVEMLWSRLKTVLSAPTVVRLSQPVYALQSMTPPLPELSAARHATPADLEELIPACAAMHREEVGIDPLVRDPAGYAARIRDLVRMERAIVLRHGGRIGFKCEYSAVTSDAVQLMGVWTAPSLRRKGLARRGMLEVCGHLLRKGKVVTLFVNDFNQPAIRLYESLGFERIGCNRALIW
jgi:uncharacterized protein